MHRNAHSITVPVRLSVPSLHPDSHTREFDQETQAILFSGKPDARRVGLRRNDKSVDQEQCSLVLSHAIKDGVLLIGQFYGKVGWSTQCVQVTVFFDQSELVFQTGRFHMERNFGPSRDREGSPL